MPVIWFCVDQLLLVVLAMTVSSWRRSSELWRRVVVVLVIDVVGACGAVLIAGAFGRLDAIGVTAVLATACGVALGVRRWRPVATEPTATPAAVPTRPVVVALIAALAGFAGVALFLVVIDGTHFTWDDLSYHATLPAQWLTAKRIELPPFTYQSYFPMNAELLATWFMLPFHGDGYASLAGGVFLAIAAFSIFGIARALGAAPTAGLAIVVVLLASTLIWKTATTFCASDLAGPALVLAALALVGRRTDSGIPDRTVGWFIPGLAFGFAIGCRPHFASALVLAGTWRIWIARRDHDDRSWRRDLGHLVAGALLSGSFWYVRNAVVTGNPVYPLNFWPWRGPLQGAALARTQLASWLVNCDRKTLGELAIRFARLCCDWPSSIGLLSWLGYASILATRTAPGTATARHAGSFRILIAGIGLISLIVFAWLPFSATCNRPSAVPLSGSEGRYLVLVQALGVGLLAPIFQRRFLRGLLVVAVTAALLAAASQLAPQFGSEGGWSFALGALSTLPAIALWSRHPIVARSWAALLLASAGAVVWRTSATKQARTDENVFAFAPPNGWIGRAWREIDRLPAGARVAVFAADPFENVQLYPLFGRRWQLLPVPLDPDGAAHRHLHLEAPHDWWRDWDADHEPVQPTELLANLTGGQIDFVLCTRWWSGAWPCQEALLVSTKRAHVVYHDNVSTIWQIQAARTGVAITPTASQTRPH